MRMFCISENIKISHNFDLNVHEIFSSSPSITIVALAVLLQNWKGMHVCGSSYILTFHMQMWSILYLVSQSQVTGN